MYYIVIVCVKIIKLPSCYPRNVGFVESSGLKWLSPRVFCPTCRWFIHILRVLVCSGPWSGRFGSLLPYLRTCIYGALPDPALNLRWLRNRCQVTETASSPFLLPTSVRFSTGDRVVARTQPGLGKKFLSCELFLGVTWKSLLTHVLNE